MRVVQQQEWNYEYLKQLNQGMAEGIEFSNKKEGDCRICPLVNNTSCHSIKKDEEHRRFLRWYL